MKHPVLASVAAMAMLVVLLLGYLHVVTGSSISFPTPITKLSFGYTETFINVDEIQSMPFLAAKLRYPLSVRALQRHGYIETDEAFHARIQREAQAEIRKTMDDIERAYQDAMAEIPDYAQPVE